MLWTSHTAADSYTTSNSISNDQSREKRRNGTEKCKILSKNSVTKEQIGVEKSF